MLQKVSKNTEKLWYYVLLLLVLSSCGATRFTASGRKQANLVIKTARSYTGTPYQWGGTSRSGMDCSGLTVRSYGAAKIDIPRTAIQQAQIGKKVKPKRLRAGDLVFFATGKKKRKITHVGIVSSRTRSTLTFIHASTSRGVTESNLSSPYYQKRFRIARRLIR